MRLIHLSCALAATLVLAATALAADNPAEEKPNVVLIFVDNFGNGDLGCFGSKLQIRPFAHWKILQR